VSHKILLGTIATSQATSINTARRSSRAGTPNARVEPADQVEEKLAGSKGRLPLLTNFSADAAGPNRDVSEGLLVMS